ncbi:MAG: WYL domain-containing protein [Candidatus Methanomethyliaceae archaeon]
MEIRVRANRIQLERSGSVGWPFLSGSRILHLLSDLLVRRDSASLRKLLNLLNEHVPVRDRGRLGRAAAGLVMRSTPANGITPDILETCLEAIHSGRALWMRYARGEEITERTVEPWNIAFAKDALYLLGFCRLRNAPREFRLDRVRECRITAEPITVPPDSGHGRWESAFGTEIGSRTFTVVVRFRPEVAYRVQGRTWHTSQRFEPLPDGGVLFRARVSSRIEVVRWVLAYGPYAELLEPADLRAKIREQLQMALAAYDLGCEREEGRK